MDDNVTREFLLEQFRALGTETVQVRDDVRHLRSDVTVLRGHVGALVQSDLARDDRFATIEARLERVERRLELTNGGEG